MDTELPECLDSLWNATATLDTCDAALQECGDVLQQALAGVQPMALEAPPLQGGAPERLD